MNMDQKQVNSATSGAPRNSPGILLLACSLGLNFLLGLAIVWVHSRPLIDLGKRLREAKMENSKLLSHSEKLAAERDVLSNQHSLEKKIKALGLDMSRPRPGQIRRLEP
ncbi:MAG: hypothetical protein LBD82_04635 [Deltaproteobacteria bacterium]|jgi:hypothetical protein|nr:hypothetical protein [Deltaproteobacteria bacterium]